MTLTDCWTCSHDFASRHLETSRSKPTAEEARRRRCRDCIDCNPPEDAPIRERERVEVPA